MKIETDVPVLFCALLKVGEKFDSKSLRHENTETRISTRCLFFLPPVCWALGQTSPNIYITSKCISSYGGHLHQTWPLAKKVRPLIRYNSEMPGLFIVTELGVNSLKKLQEPQLRNIAVMMNTPRWCQICSGLSHKTKHDRNNCP